MKRIVGLLLSGLCAVSAFGKLPPLSDEAKAKAAEGAAKAAHDSKVAGFHLCKAMDRVAAGYLAERKKAGKEVKPVATPACVDPGPFVHSPPAMGAAPAPTKPAAKKS